MPNDDDDDDYDPSNDRLTVNQAQETHVGVAEKPFRKQYRSFPNPETNNEIADKDFRLFHAAFAQFCYTGAQGQ